MNPKHLARLDEGVGTWNRWRVARPDVTPDLSEADLHEINLRDAFLRYTNLRGANLSGADLYHAQLTNANLDHANLANSKLCYTDMIAASLRLTDLSNAILESCQLSHANLERANLQRAESRLGDFEKSNLRHAILTEADLRDANFSGADLVGANFTSADLSRSDFSEASMRHTVFGYNDLSTVIGLETVHHRGPSTIDSDTMYRSKGRIPESFLRGCGIRDDFTTFIKSLATSPIQFYSCFISYSTKDQAFADRLYADLQNKGVRCWFAPHDVQGGRKLHEQIDEAIRLHDKLLLILSPHSMESEWVKTEIAKARKREVRDQRRVLFPIRLAPFETLRDWESFDADTGKDSAREIREYFIPDFSNWKDHDSYQEAFQRLISDLKASDSKSR